MFGTAEVLPAGSSRPRIGPRVKIVIGAPLDFSRYVGMEDDRFVLRSMTDEVMYELMELGGQEYVDVYAAKAKDQLSAARAEVKKKAEQGDRVPVGTGRKAG
jgi:1-acyl-sn-glycerol-3-phosphate acyltransferase